jgi:hypothetical protein
MEMMDLADFVLRNIKTLFFGAIIVEALVEIVGDFLPRKWSVKGARFIGAILGIACAFTFNVSIVESLSETVNYQTVAGTVIAGLIMSRGAEWMHSLFKTLTNLPKLIQSISVPKEAVKNAVVAIKPPVPPPAPTGEQQADGQ